MGSPTTHLRSLYQQLDWAGNKLILEIGSERGEYSTYTLSDIAKDVKCKFITIDVTDDARRKVHGTAAEFVVCDAGSSWCRSDLPALVDYKINILYLDNFDWTWDEANPHEHIIQQRKEYLQRGTIMNNFNCAQEHLSQMLACLPCMADQCLIVCDDTWKCPNEGIYIGKCGVVVHYLLYLGFDLLLEKDLGIILGRNIKTI